MKCYWHPLHPASPSLTFLMNSVSWGKTLISDPCLFSLNCFLNSEITVCDTCHQLHDTLLPTACGFSRVLGFSCLGSKHSGIFLNIPLTAGGTSQQTYFLTGGLHLPESRCGEDDGDLGKLLSGWTPPWGTWMLQVGGKKRSIPRVLCLDVFSSKKITFMGFESEPFHTENFVIFPLCPLLPQSSSVWVDSPLHFPY